MPFVPVKFVGHASSISLTCMTFFKKLRWFWFTRAAGLIVFLYEVALDRSVDRATIIIAACGLMGLDKVARSEDTTE